MNYAIQLTEEQIIAVRACLMASANPAADKFVVHPETPLRAQAMERIAYLAFEDEALVDYLKNGFGGLACESDLELARMLHALTTGNADTSSVVSLEDEMCNWGDAS